MGRKGSCEHDCEHDHNEEDELTIEEQVEKAIKALPTLEEKVQAIALNQYLIEKRELDKKLQNQINKIEVNDRKTYEPYLTEIFNIISGNADLTDADFEGVEDLLTEQEKQVKANYYPKKQLEEYWLKALMSSEEAGETIEADDENVLKHLVNITASKTEDGNHLTVTFFFSENEWFSNASIKKEFELDGEDIKRSFGDAVEWKEGKNLTVQIVKKKNKKKKTTTTKQIKKKSFFNLFNEVDLSSDNEEDNDDDAEEENDDVEQLETQYEICNAIYENVIPRSLEHYLGVSPLFGDLGMEGDLEDIEEEEEEQEDKPKKGKNKKRKGSHSSKQ